MQDLNLLKLRISCGGITKVLNCDLKLSEGGILVV